MQSKQEGITQFAKWKCAHLVYIYLYFDLKVDRERDKGSEIDRLTDTKRRLHSMRNKGIGIGIE